MRTVYKLSFKRRILVVLFFYLLIPIINNQLCYSQKVLKGFGSNLSQNHEKKSNNPIQGDVKKYGLLDIMGANYIFNVNDTDDRSSRVNFTDETGLSATLIDEDGNIFKKGTQSFGFYSGFQDVTDIAGVAGALSNGGSGIAWGDYNADGYQDIYITYGSQNATAMNNILYKNMGDGTFTDVTSALGVEAYGKGSGVAFGDYDNDGDLDFVTGVVEGDLLLFKNEGLNLYTQVAGQAGLNLIWINSCAWADMNNDGFLDLFAGQWSFNGSCYLFFNNQDGTFRNVTGECIPLITSWFTGVSFGDYDNDGDQDLCITLLGSKGFNGLNVLIMKNDNTGKFTDVTSQAGVFPYMGSCSSASWGDYNNDGYLDLIITGFSDRGNINILRLYKNNGDGTFDDVSNKAGFHCIKTNSATWGDYDNDGYLDIYVSTQFSYFDHLLHNDGDGTFSDMTSQEGITHPSNTTMNSVWADYDQDGFLDLYVNTYYSEDLSKNYLYRNNGNDNNWLVVELKGSIGNKNGIGARVILFANTLFSIREVDGGLGTFQNSLPVEFGLGKVNKVDSLVIKWPSGIVDTYRDIQPNQYLIARENEALISSVREDEDKSMIPDFYILDQNYPNPFNSSTTIRFSLPKSGFVTLKIYSLLGQEIDTLVSEQKSSGEHEVEWNAEGLSSGIYLYRLKAGEFMKTKKLVLQR